MMTDHELEQRLQRAACQWRAPEPSAGQLSLIMARRAAGERIEVRAVPRPGPWATSRLTVIAVAACLALVLIPLVRTRRGHPQPLGPDTIDMSAGWGLPSDVGLMAQTTAEPRFPVLGIPSGEGLRPGRWIYSAEAPLEVRPWDTLFVYAVEQSQLGGQAAWLLLAGRQAPGGQPAFVDSTWISRETFEVLGQRSDTTVRWQPVPATFLAVLQGSRSLGPDWSASVPLLSRSPSGVQVRKWMNLKVYGQDSVQVPAGSFISYRIGFSPSIGFYFWINGDGWPVRQGMIREDDLSFGRMNLYLVRVEPR